MNRDVVDLPELLGDKDAVRMPLLGRTHSGIPNTSDNSIQLINPTIGFLRNDAALRIEVMHLENQLESTIHNIYTVRDSQ